MRYGKTFTVLLTILLSSTALAGEAQFIPAHQQPPDNGAKPGTGRAGSAKLFARALLDVYQETTLEASTGDFNSEAPGNIKKLQVKLTHGDKKETLNYNNLSSGGFVSVPLVGLFHDDDIQVQANITGIDPHRTGVVTVETTVKFRPDLSVVLEVPAQAGVNEDVEFTARVSELKGDVAATTDVILEVEDQEVDRAEFVTVLNGGTSDATFHHTFATTGKKRLRVTLRNVDPGDYDPSNNSATAEIEIRSDTLPFRLTTLVASETESSITTWTTDSGENRTTTQSGYQSFAQFSGFFDGHLDLANTELDVQHFSGTLFCEQSFRPTSANFSRGSYSVTTTGQSATITPTFRMVNGVKVLETKITVTRSSSNYKYFSNGWSVRYPGKQGTHYVFNESGQVSLFGAQGRYGTSYSMRVNVRDGRNTFETNPTIPLAVTVSYVNVPRSCGTNGSWGQVCTEKWGWIRTLSGNRTDTY